MQNKLTNAVKFIKKPHTLAGVAVLSALAIVLTACGGQAQAAIKATWITPQVSGESVSVPASEIEKNTIVHFRLPLGSLVENFMAYNLGGETYVRANVCPPCRSIGFSLEGDKLICDTCATVFDAKTGDGISGACVNFPKGDIPFQVNDGKIVMNTDDMNTAYQNTLTPGRP